ncbi:hypothetical protein PVL29_009232 [Vitis rotundifolia]|uniref:Uncharacterized protein n=1 Tax=Vitis rotundifolia TaxID=103349 RepID=A0AA38ZXW3_VITRO|nr:hypothetical protein PVL29_009232 [Vitis rotundifolia]
MELSIPPSPILKSREELSYTSGIKIWGRIHQCEKIISIKEMHGLCSGLISTKCLYVIRELLTKLLER